MASGISFSGLASGIDSSALIKSLMDQERSVKIDPLTTKISTLQDQNSSFSELSTLLSTLKSKADTFRSLNGAGLSYGATSSDETVLSGAASQNAVEGTYELTVSQLAKNATVSFGSTGTTYSSATSVISSGSAFSDTVSVTIGDTGSPLDTVEVAITETTTLQDFVTSFNSQTSDATASIVNVGTASAADYRIVIATKNTGEDKGAISFSVGATTSARGAFDNNQTSAAKNAIFSISGIGSNIERSTNTVSDILQGVTFTVRGAGVSTLSVGVDATDSASALKAFVGAYNEVIEYIAEQDSVTRDESGSEVTNLFGPLATSSLDESIVSTLRSALMGSSSTGGVVNVLADLGVSTQRDGTLKFDESAFISAVGSDAAGATRVLNRLGDTLANTNGTIDQFTGFGRLLDGAKNTNNSEVSRLTQQINTYEKFLAQREQSLVSRFAGLEQLMSKLNSTQSALAQLLP